MRTREELVRALVGRLTRAKWEGGMLRRQGNFLSAYLYSAYAILGLKRPVRVSINSQRLWIRPRTPDITVACETFGGEFDEAIKSATPLQHNFIIDAGGYIGTAAIIFAQAFPAATVVTLEPSEQHFPLLVRNTQPYSNIVPIKCALAATEEKSHLYDRRTGEWGYSMLNLPRKDGAEAFPLHVIETLSIPTLLRRFHANGIDLLKLDIEGAERELFADRPTWVKTTRVIFAEIHDRVFAGSAKAFREATLGRVMVPCKGEKILSTLA